MEVLNIEADLYNFNNYRDNNQRFYDLKYDFQVITKYINETTYAIIVRRLDKNEGWNIHLQVLAVYLDNNTSSIIDVGISREQEKEIIVKTDFQISESNKPIEKLPIYNLLVCPEPEKMSREEFNALFNTDIVCLPRQLYAFGLDNGRVYVYSEGYIMYHESIRQVKLILSIALSFTDYKKFYFIVTCCDGYMELTFNDKRIIPKIIKNDECTNLTLEENEYPVFHKQKYIVSQSNDINMPYTIDMIDRHYLYCDLYNPFRSFHRGIKFDTKINKIVVGCRRERSWKQNFKYRRDIDMGQREYFYSDAIPKENIVYPNWICDHDMVGYKYILDIDGNSCTWDATAWKLNSGSVILKTESRWRQWFYDDYLPWVHYVPIKDDFSNLQEMYQWCEENQDKCREIITNAKQLFQKTYRFHNVVKYTITLLDKLHEIND
jgi:hypothetical protein